MRKRIGSESESDKKCFYWLQIIYSFYFKLTFGLRSGMHRFIASGTLKPKKQYVYNPLFHSIDRLEIRATVITKERV